MAEGQVGNVDVEDDTGWEGVFVIFLYDLLGNVGGGFPVGVLVCAERNSNAGNTENNGFAGSRYGAGGENTYTRVRPKIDTADDEVGRVVFTKVAEGKFDAVGGCATNGESKGLVVYFGGGDFEGVGEGDGMSGSASFGVGGNDIDLAVWLKCLMKFIDSSCVDSVVIA